MLMSRNNSKTGNIKLCFSVTIDNVFSLFESSLKEMDLYNHGGMPPKPACFLWTGRQKKKKKKVYP